MTAEARPLTSPRGNRVAVAVLAALGAAVIIVSLSGTGTTTAAGGRLGGDFPEFYGAGRIIRAGDAAELYEAARQAESQEGLFGDEEEGSYLDFAYPPVVALVYAPLSALPYRVAYLIHVGLMAGLVWLALRLVAPMVGFVRHNPALALAGVIAFYPMFRAVGSGQNTALTVACFAGAWRARHDGRELASGMWLGALLFKPQLAVIALLAQVVSRRWQVLAGASLTALALWAVSAATMGVGWVGPFLRHGMSVPGGDDKVAGGGSVSLLGSAQRFDGVVEDAFVVAAILGSVAVAGACLVAWRRSDSGHPVRLRLGFAALAAGTVLASPHVIFYDAGLLVIVGLYALERPSPRTLQVLLASVVVSWLGAFDDLPVNPLLPMSMAVFGWVMYRAMALPPVREDAPQAPEVATPPPP